MLFNHPIFVEKSMILGIILVGSLRHRQHYRWKRVTLTEILDYEETNKTKQRKTNTQANKQRIRLILMMLPNSLSFVYKYKTKYIYESNTFRMSVTVLFGLQLSVLVLCYHFINMSAHPKRPPIYTFPISYCSRFGTLIFDACGWHSTLTLMDINYKCISKTL